jgi:cyanophycin synthetase
MPTTVADLVELQSSIRPDEVAVLTPQRSLTFAQLQDRVNSAAQNLRGRGIVRGMVVGLACESELGVLVLMLALVRLGAALLSIPGTMPVLLRRRLLAQAGAQLIVSDVAAMDQSGLPHVAVDLATLATTHSNNIGLPGEAGAEDVWLIIAGSGTTGRPRLLPVTHAQFLARVRLAADALQLSPMDRLLSLAKLDFTSPKERCLAALAVGASIVLECRGIDPVSACTRFQVTVLDATVVHLEKMLARQPVGASHRLARVRLLQVSASTVSSGLRQRMASILTPNLLVRYGTNETGLVAVAPPALVHGPAGTVGKPAAEVAVEIVDKNGTGLPANEVGLIRIRTPGLIDAYLGDEEATAQAFGPDGFLPGDLGRLTPDGQLVFCGRSDDMMIKNGINIYPAEIEAEVSGHPEVLDVAAFSMKSAMHQDIPACALVLRPGAAVSEQALLAWTRERLGAHAPERIVILDRLPRNAQGKPQRAELRSAIAAWRGTAAPTPAAVSDGRVRLVQRLPDTLRFRVAWTRSIPAANNVVDDWLRGLLEVDFDPDLIESALDSSRSGQQEGAVATRIPLLARGLLLAARVPVFAPYRLLKAKLESTGGGVAWVEVPRLDHIAERASVLALEAATVALENCVAAAQTGGGRSQLLVQIEKDALRPIRRLFNSGKSTLPLLRAAWQHGIPFIHLGGGVFQLGWGARARRIDRSTTDGDPATAAKLAQNKVWTASLLRKAGLPAPQHQVVTTLEAARLAARDLGWPLVIKPADRDRGEGVSVNVTDVAVLERAFAVAHKVSGAHQVIVERQVAGVCHRLFIARGRLLYAVIRWPKSVHGDGIRSIAALIRDANAAEALRPPWLRSEPFPADAEAVAAMAVAGYAPDAIPAAGARIPLRAIESTATGGFDEEVTDRIHPDNLDIALRATALFGLEVAGIDIITPDIGTPWHANGAIINEVNYAPLLGGGEISRRHVPEFLNRLLQGNGRIPVEAFVGGDAAMAAARARQGELVAAGIACFLTSHATTLNAAGLETTLSLGSIYTRCRALLVDHRVEALLLVVQNDELLRTGLPVDRIDRIVPSADDTGSDLSQHSQAALMQLLQTMPPHRGHSFSPTSPATRCPISPFSPSIWSATSTPGDCM